MEIPCFEWTLCFNVKAVFWIPDVFLNGIQSLGQDRQEARWGRFCIFWVKLLPMVWGVLVSGEPSCDGVGAFNSCDADRSSRHCDEDMLLPGGAGSAILPVRRGVQSWKTCVKTNVWSSRSEGFGAMCRKIDVFMHMVIIWGNHWLSA